jgi:hypothetical protein
MHVHLIGWGPEQLITAVRAADADSFVYGQSTLKIVPPTSRSEVPLDSG